MGTLTLQEARDYLNTPTTLSRGVDYLGSDEEFHYFEHRLEIARDVRFRIRCTDGIYLPHETMPYRSWFPERRDAYTALLGLSLSISPDSSCVLNGTRYTTPAEIPPDLWPKVGKVHFDTKSPQDIRRLEQELQPYLKNASRIRYTHATSSLLPRCKQEAGE